MQNKVIYDNNGSNLTFQSYMSKVFAIVGLGLLVSGVVAFAIGMNYITVLNFLGAFGILGVFLPIILEFVVVIYFSRRLMTMSKQTAYICFFLYSLLTGISFAYIFAVYSIGNIAFAFASTTMLFICMSILGKNTSLDLSKASSYLFYGLLGIIISSLLNVLIFKSSTMDLIISYVAVIIFLVLIAYDMQRLRTLYDQGMYDSELNEKLLIFGSFQLYLDFINLFIRILQIFSRRRND